MKEWKVHFPLTTLVLVRMIRQNWLQGRNL
jgi:hypothetical protein